MNKIILLITLPSILIFTSCSKDDTRENNDCYTCCCLMDQTGTNTVEYTLCNNGDGTVTSILNGQENIFNLNGVSFTQYIQNEISGGLNCNKN